MAAVESAVGRIEVKGTPSEEEVAAIIAAIEMVWPKPAPPRKTPPQSTAWRHSGRWWSEGRLPNSWG